MKRRRKRILPVDGEIQESAPMPTPVTEEVKPPAEEIPPVEEAPPVEEIPPVEEVPPPVEEVPPPPAEEEEEEVEVKVESNQPEYASYLHFLLALEGNSEPLTVPELKNLVGFVKSEKDEFKHNLGYITSCGWVTRTYIKGCYRYALSANGAKKITELMQ